jgi:predicted PurR-regulated permease PerM
MSEKRVTENRRSDIVFTLGLLLAGYVAWLVRDVLVLLYVSALFAVALTPLVQAVSGLKLGKWQPFKGIGLLVLLVGAGAGLTLFGFLALPPVISDLQSFAQELPTRLPAILGQVKRLGIMQGPQAAATMAKAQDMASNAATYLLYSAKNWAGGLFDVVMGIVMTIYFILEGDQAYAWFLSLVNPEERGRLDGALRRAETRISSWLVGQGSLMLILGVASTIVYVSLGVRYAYALGFLTGLLNIIPVVGAAVCIGLALLVAAIDSWGRVIGVAVFYVIYLNLENSFLIPRIMKSRVDLPGWAILVALLIGSSLAGVLGAMVSVPTAVLVAALLDEYLVHKEDGVVGTGTGSSGTA